MPRIAIIGAGPAGLMAALSAAETGRSSVEIFDAGVPLSTLLRTGGGRCNLTNAETDRRTFSAQYPRGGKFLLGAFSRFDSARTMEWFSSRGLALTVEEGGRVFPRTGRAESVRDLLSSEARQSGVRLMAQAAVAKAARVGGGFEVPTPAGRQTFDRLIIATGGDWEDRAGSGYRLARALGHTVTPLAPSLAALETEETWPARVAGLTLPAARLSAMEGKRRLADERGSLLFTHTGISGPLAFRVSSRCAFVPFSPRSSLRLSLKILPERNLEDIDTALSAALRAHPRLEVSSALRGLVPRSLAGILPELAGVPPATSGSQLSRAGRRAIASLMDRLPLSAIGTRKGAEMVTAGGIPLDEVDPRSMESRIVRGLFFCGEVLDIDGFTGGFNLQAAWTTGRCAGLAAGA